MRTVRVYHVLEAPPGAKLIDRRTVYGNPYAIGVHGDRDYVCDLFERNVLPTLDVEPLRGYDLACHCKPARCHGDSIMRKLYGEPIKKPA
jgi:Domain of unknown function (DUF4326)